MTLDWQSLDTAPRDGQVILRHHVIWGVMDVRYLTGQGWTNGDYTMRWPEEAFDPCWAPLPDPPPPHMRIGLTASTKPMQRSVSRPDPARPGDPDHG